jgi:fumarylacetoacetate (FAA) hydrolase
MATLPISVPPAFRDFYSFEQHVKTCRAKRGLTVAEGWYQAPVFYYSNPFSLVGPDAPVSAPEGCRELDYELELGAVIGTGGKNIRRENAWNHIAGFIIVNDFSARDIQRREMAVGLGPAKAKDFATAVGPRLVPLSELGAQIDGEKITLAMSARVNGKTLSQGNSRDLYFSFSQMIEFASQDCELRAGDLLGSGTIGTGCILELGPENTGGWLKPGDVVELEIERLGVLRNPIVARS